MPEMETADLDIVLRGSAAAVRLWCQDEKLMGKGAATAFADLPSFSTAIGLITSVDPFIHRLSDLAQSVTVSHTSLLTVLHLEVTSIVASPWFGSSGSYTEDVALGLTAHFRELMHEMTDLPGGSPRTSVLRPKALCSFKAVPSESVTLLAAAALERLVSERGQDDYQLKLSRIRSVLGLRSSELSRLLDVTPQGLRKWEQGGSIARARIVQIDDIHNFANWLTRHIKPEALPAFMRRNVPALSNQTPLAWVVAGRIPELRSIYDSAFSRERMG
jgi:hypothetical protein